jgi:hypothetical protein
MRRVRAYPAAESARTPGGRVRGGAEGSRGASVGVPWPCPTGHPQSRAPALVQPNRTPPPSSAWSARRRGSCCVQCADMCLPGSKNSSESGVNGSVSRIYINHYRAAGPPCHYGRTAGLPGHHCRLGRALWTRISTGRALTASSDTRESTGWGRTRLSPCEANGCLHKYHNWHTREASRPRLGRPPSL